MIPILDAGHGGMIGGVYQTSGKRSPKWHSGVLYEGMFNRWLVNRVIEKLDRANVPYFHVSPSQEDTPLSQRVRSADEIHRKNGNTYFLSFHSNAGGGTGFEVFTSKGETKSDNLAEMFIHDLHAAFPDIAFRMDCADGDMDKEADFYVLKHTDCPAMLLEILFMDNKEDYKKLWDERFLDRTASTIANTIIKLYHGYGKQ
jgi:N-acetylmuramoyl-L-alanine amidase